MQMEAIPRRKSEEQNAPKKPNAQTPKKVGFGAAGEDAVRAELLAPATATQKRKELLAEDTSSIDEKLDDEKFRHLDLTSEEIDYEELRELMRNFQTDMDPEVKKAVDEGVDLREYARQVQEKLAQVEKDSTADYLNEMESFGALHSQIKACDQILETMENLLRGFQADLGNISDEIKILQDRSSSLNVQLNNRKDLSAQLSGFVNGIVVSKELIREICETEVNDAYLQYLLELNKKMAFAEVQPEGVVAKKDITVELDKLRIKAVSKIREFLLTKINSLKRPKTNIQIMQQSVLLKYKYFFRFLFKHAPEIAIELYNAQMRTYISTLSKLQMEGTTKTDLIGIDESQTKSFWSTKFAKTRATNIFSLGDRGNILAELERPSIVPHEAVEKQLRLPYELLFRSMNHLLTDTVSAEYLFDKEFFGKMDLFIPIFDKFIVAQIESVETYLRDSFDTISILIISQIAQRSRAVMEKRQIHCLASYFEKVKELSWARLTTVLEFNLDSVKKVIPKNLGPIDNRPHYIIRRYAELLSAILTVMGPHADADRRLLTQLNQLRTAMGDLIVRLANELTKKERTVFLINNYNLIVSLAPKPQAQIQQGEKESKDSESPPPTQNEDVSYFNNLLTEQVRSFADEELNHYFARLVVFLRDVDEQLRKGVTEPTIDKATLDALIKELSTHWKEYIEQVNRDVIKSFPDFVIGGEILKILFHQFAKLYSHFEEVTKKHAKVSSKDIVPSNIITYEFKKYMRTFES